MNERKKKIILNSLGGLFLVWGVFAVANSIRLQNPSQIFWNCYLGLLLIGIGIFNRNSKLIGAQLSILAIPLIIWDVDFLYYLFTGNSLWGITNYMFLERRVLLSQFISLQHLFTLPLSLYALFLIKVRKFDFWKIAIVQVTLLFFVIMLRTTPEENIGCVFENCLSFSLEGLGINYSLFWFLVFFCLIFLTTFILSRIKIFRK